MSTARTMAPAFIASSYAPWLLDIPTGCPYGQPPPRLRGGSHRLPLRAATSPLAGRLQAAVDDRLLLGVLQERLDSVLLAEARLLRAAERELVVSDLQGIDPRVTCLELVDRPVRRGHVPRPDRRAEAELRVIGEA